MVSLQRMFQYFQLEKARLLWLLFVTELVILSTLGIEVLFGYNFGIATLVRLALVVPILLVVAHSFLTLSVTRGLLFVTLAALIGFLAEYYSLNFGGNYHYNLKLQTFFTVPLIIIAYWAVYIYLGYSLVNSFLIWLKKKKPSILDKNFYLLPALLIADGLVIVAIDLFMDPISVKTGSWSWVTHGPYFGIPTNNFTSWFLVATFTSGIFRLYEYFNPLKTTVSNKSLFLIPALGYCLLAQYFVFYSVKLEMFNLAFIGSLFMFPTALINIGLYLIYRSKSD